MLESPAALTLARLPCALTVSFASAFTPPPPAPRRPPVLLSALLSLRIPRVFHRACQLSRRPRRALAPDRPRNVSQPLSVLAQDLRDHLRDGRRIRDRDVVPVRHELVGVLRPRRPGHRAADGLRRALGGRA